ncbi:MAG: TauD/TfdA family dioxygenase [Pseudomonadota bacterium]|nr:TauD/TfdA family dioxygenase [Pseudomonadota bacterium]
MTEHVRKKIQEISQGQDGFTVGWCDGDVSHFHFIWLRHQCECGECGSSLNGVRGLRLDLIPERPKPREYSFDPDRLRVSWEEDGHISTYEAKWLRDHCYSAEARAQRKHRPVLWDKRIAADPPTFNFSEVEDSPSSRLQMLETVCDYGFCKVEGAPGLAQEAGRLIQMVGAKRITHYGDFELSNKRMSNTSSDMATLTDKKSINNVGDIRQALQPHCDETYRTSTIGITIFQVFEPSAEGGHSTLVDGFEAARRFREIYPEDFNRLASTPLTGQRFDPKHAEGELPRWYRCTLPMIRIDDDQHVCGIRVNERQIAPIDLPHDQVVPTYRAIRNFLKIVYDPDLIISFPLKKGDGLIFNNQRVLHGRTAFKLEERGRQVLTNSVDLEDFYSNLRILKGRLKPQEPIQAYSQGMVT